VAAEDIVLRPSGSRSDAGKYPENWECTSLKVESAKASPRKPLLLPQKKKDRKQSLTTSELSLLQKTIRKMDAASSKIVLERLKEEWTEVVDASVYRELELEKQLWMLAGLKALNKDKSATNFDKHRGVSTATSRKMLSLYENQGQS
jgi:Fe2+ or Zn2+ uptake regulation protein